MGVSSTFLIRDFQGERQLVCSLDYSYGSHENFQRRQCILEAVADTWTLEPVFSLRAVLIAMAHPWGWYFLLLV